MKDSPTSKTSPHTPGPWQFYADLPSTDPNWHIVTNASRMRVVANVHIEPGNAMDLANAHLIAAAPDLLSLAKQHASECADCDGTGRYHYTFALPSMAMAQQGEPCEACADIRAVIAKAEGRS